MSRAVSKITTIKCDRFQCEKERIIVGDDVENNEGWAKIEDLDLCPKHKKEYKEFFFGPQGGIPDIFIGKPGGGSSGEPVTNETC